MMCEEEIALVSLMRSMWVIVIHIMFKSVLWLDAFSMLGPVTSDSG
jgi:hypothetical protein